MNAVRSRWCYMLRMGLLGHATHQNQCLPVDHLQDQDLSSECGRERTGVFAHHYSGKLETCYQDRARCVCVCVCVLVHTVTHTYTRVHASLSGEVWRRRGVCELSESVVALYLL